MDYISAKEAAALWGTDVRTVREYCREGRVPGARRHGEAWTIPSGARKPAHKGRGDARPPLYPGLFLMENIRLDGRSPEEIAASLPNDAYRRQFFAELAYVKGDMDKVIPLLSAKTDDDGSLALCALHVRCAACVSNADYEGFTACMSGLEDLYMLRGAHLEEAALIELSQATILTSLYAVDGCPEWLINGDLSGVPAGAKLYAVYVYARYLHSRMETDRMLGVIEAALALSGGPGITVSELYLKIMYGVALVETGQPKKARELIRQTFALAQPYGIYNPFSESMSTLRGEMDAALKKSFPKEYRLVLNGWKRVFSGWVEIHNRITGENVPTLLTLKEHQIGLYLCQGLSYKEISVRMGLSPNTINNYIQSMRGKLGVKTRAEVAERMRWSRIIENS